MPHEVMEIKDTRSWLHDHVVADKAIVALHLLRLSRQAGQKGVGPNRDDLPLFQELVDKWANGTGGHKETVLRARARVVKYGRQLLASPYIDLIRDPAIPRQMLIEKGLDIITKHRADQELYQHIRQQEQHQYGQW